MRPLVILAAAAILTGCAAPTSSAGSGTTTPLPTATAAAPTRAPSPTAPRATASPRPQATRSATHHPATTHTTRAPAPARVVHPGAYCTPEGATGRTAKGTLMRCTRKAGEAQARWRRA